MSIVETKKTLRNSNERMLRKKGVSPYYFTVLTYFPSPWFLSWLDVYYWWGRDISFWTLTTWLSWHLLWSLFEYRASCLAWILLLLALHVSLCFPWRGSSNDFYSYVLRNTPTERDRMFSASKQKLGKKGGIQSKSSLLSSITWVTPCFLFHFLSVFPSCFSLHFTRLPPPTVFFFYSIDLCLVSRVFLFSKYIYI